MLMFLERQKSMKIECWMKHGVQYGVDGQMTMTAGWLVALRTVAVQSPDHSCHDE